MRASCTRRRKRPPHSACPSKPGAAPRPFPRAPANGWPKPSPCAIPAPAPTGASPSSGCARPWTTWTASSSTRRWTPPARNAPGSAWKWTVSPRSSPRNAPATAAATPSMTATAAWPCTAAPARHDQQPGLTARLGQDSFGFQGRHLVPRESGAGQVGGRSRLEARLLRADARRAAPRRGRVLDGRRHLPVPHGRGAARRPAHQAQARHAGPAPIRSAGRQRGAQRQDHRGRAGGAQPGSPRRRRAHHSPTTPPGACSTSTTAGAKTSAMPPLRRAAASIP